MSLSQSQIDQFRQEGYTTAPAMFTAREIDAIRAELDRLRRHNAFRNVATEGDGATPAKGVTNLQICPLYPHSTLFRALPFCEKVVEAITQLLGDPLILHLDQVFLKPARHGGGTNWHQDNAYFKIDDPMHGTAMWIAVHDATLANGTLRVIPGVARQTFEHVRDPQSNHHIRCYPPEERAVPIELPAGGAAFFCYGLPHCTGANNTDHDRAGLAYHFLRSDSINPAFKSTIGTVLTGPTATGGAREYGANVAGTWEQEVQRALTASA